MDTLLSFFKYAVIGFVGLIGLLFLLAIVFGKRVVKEWDYEAEFRNADGREFGEFDIESSRIEKEEPTFSLKAKFKMRHSALALHQAVQIYIDDLLILEGRVENEGRVFLTQKEHLKNSADAVRAGQMCRVVLGGTTLCEEPLVED